MDKPDRSTPSSSDSPKRSTPPGESEAKDAPRFESTQVEVEALRAMLNPSHDPSPDSPSTS